MYKNTKTLFVGTFITLAFPLSTVFASSGCVPIYGGGYNCPKVGQVLIDKKVLNPSTGIFVDNLGPSDPKYKPQQVVTFRLIVKNSGDQNLETVTVKDTLPQFVDFMSGPGEFDKKTGVLTFTVNNLAGGESQTMEIKARTVHPAVLPESKNIVCPVNTVDAVAGDQKDHDESQFCIEKKQIVPAVPKAGPESVVLTLVGLGSSLIAGLKLRKKSRLI
jgi:uncharacterized repeat protein (TIGR01451 family)